MKQYVTLFLLGFTIAFGFAACGGDDDDDRSDNPTGPAAVNENGTTTNGSNFIAIDDKNFYIDYIKYSVEEGHLIVSGFDKAGFKGVANIVPAISYKGNNYEVLKIDDNAFKGCQNLTSVTIPNSVTLIGSSVFNSCSGLTSVTIPNSVTSIGDYAFGGCSGLASVTIPNSITSIGKSAFHGCSGLTSVTIPNSVTSIGDYAFEDCSGLTSFTVESGNTVYDSRDNCNALIETQSNTLIQGCNNSVIPNSVTSIGYTAFYDCSSMTSLKIPNSVTSIGLFAFVHCSGLTSVTIPNSVTSIGDQAFEYCSGLTSIVVESDNTVYDSRDNCNALIKTKSNTLIKGCKSTVIPNSVTSIGEGAFSGCSGLTSITIPNSVTYIGRSAFSGCSGLTSIHCKRTTPPSIDYYSPFSGKISTLYVPKGSRSSYQSSQWKNHFENIVEE